MLCDAIPSKLKRPTEHVTNCRIALDHQDMPGGVRGLLASFIEAIG
jgi:hypothetical protein